MVEQNSNEVTRLLEQIRESPEMFDQIIPLVYDDLRRIGHNQRAQMNMPQGPTLQTTALVHEAFIKLRGDAGRPIEDSRHFRHLAAKVMRQLILDYARKQASDKRGGGLVHEELSPERRAGATTDEDFVLAVEDAMRRLEGADPRQAEVAAASFYAGYTAGEIAAMLSISERTVRRELQKARAWLMLELSDTA